MPKTPDTDTMFGPRIMKAWQWKFEIIISKIKNKT